MSSSATQVTNTNMFSKLVTVVLLGILFPMPWNLYIYSASDFIELFDGKLTNQANQSYELYNFQKNTLSQVLKRPDIIKNFTVAEIYTIYKNHTNSRLDSIKKANGWYADRWRLISSRIQSWVNLTFILLTPTLNKYLSLYFRTKIIWMIAIAIFMMNILIFLDGQQIYSTGGDLRYFSCGNFDFEILSIFVHLPMFAHPYSRIFIKVISNPPSQPKSYPSN